MVHGGDVAVSNRLFDGVLVAPPGFVPLQGSSVKESFEDRRTELGAELAGVPRDGSGTRQAGGIERIAVAGGAESGGRGHAETRTEVEGHSDTRGGFVASGGVGRLYDLISAGHHPLQSF